MILVLGENAAWQKSCFADLFLRGEVNRIRATFESAAGKGANVARVLATLGEEVLLYSYAGGPTGERYAEACRADSIPIEVIPIGAETRTCTTVIEPDGSITEIIEPSPQITSEESESMYLALLDRLTGCRLFVISGTAVSGEAGSRYRDLVEAAHERGVPVLLDSYREHGRLALAASPEILKINTTELADLSGRPTGTSAERKAACEELASKHSIRWVIITLGSSGAEGYSEARAARSTPPPVTLVNSIGSGDSFTAGVASVVARAGGIGGASIDLALRSGTALGTANCLDVKPGRVDLEEYRRIYDAVRIDLLG